MKYLKLFEDIEDYFNGVSTELITDLLQDLVDRGIIVITKEPEYGVERSSLKRRSSTSLYDTHDILTGNVVIKVGIRHNMGDFKSWRDGLPQLTRSVGGNSFQYFKILLKPCFDRIYNRYKCNVFIDMDRLERSSGVRDCTIYIQKKELE